ncbi:gamma-tubulin complex component 5 isoform X2 [Aphidius gifuensis]|uniref:gamma-tubulin complex component 5 isoform X2 n=1 Tax=Aphidius gifuensis TaxID=684658 RepID=UPI001CDCCDF6|nr:gamma-tubulin complex component 5 isoform X2 [Aphidius gifuensis]
MGTKILNDIQNDLKLLIISLTGFEESDEAFRVCEKYVTSNISHHRFLSIDSHATKRKIADVKKKFIIHGKYDVAREFERLVDTFLTSFDFEHHPQYDLQWSLLLLILELSTDTTKSSIDCLQVSSIDKSLSITEENEVNEIDWAEHLKEGQENFFCQYQSSSESDWSDDEDDKKKDDKKISRLEIKEGNKKLIPTEENALQKIDHFDQVTKSRNWLNSNIENSWWNDVNKHESQVVSRFSHAHLCAIYHKEIKRTTLDVGTITEYQALREVLWMFHVPMEMVVYYEKTDNKFFVKDNLSIPSLTPAAFNSAFTSLTPYFSMINRLKLFEKNLHLKYNINELPPLTLEAYIASMKQHMSQVKNNIIEIEKKVMRQDDINTFLTLTKDLQSDLKTINLLDGIHCLVTSNLIESDNHIKSYRLLSSIYQQMEASSSRERTNLCASIYLSSLSVYLNIVDTWLSEGRLEDFRHEFLINKVVDNTKSEDDLTRVTFVTTKCTDKTISDPVLIKLFQKVMDIGRSIEILVTLDRLSDMWKKNTKQFENNRVPLSVEFVTQVLFELKIYSSNNNNDEPDMIEQDEDVDSSSTKSEKLSGNNTISDMEENIKQQILRINNPFLMKAFQTYLPPVLNIDTVDAKSNNKNNNNSTEIYDKLEKISPYILPFRKVLENVLDEILDRRYSCAAKLVKDILVNEYKLEHHLKLMRSIYMMEREHVMKKFFQQEMFYAIENHSSITNPYSMRIFMEEVLPDEWRDSKSDNHWSMTINDIRTRQVLQAVDGTVLHYSINWPVNMVLTDDTLEKYNTIFKFQLKLKWAVWTLSDLRFKDLEESCDDDMTDVLQHFYARRLECLRFWLLHAIGSIHSYLSGQVLQNLGSILEKKLANANNLYSIIEAHNDYLDRVHEHCLQTPQFSDILVTINNMLGMCAHVRDRWKNGAKQLISSDLDIMETSYTKYHTYLALALHNAVQNKEADFLTGLTSAFNESNLPCTE